MSAYQIKLPKFEGPFDLLLFFIERDELDIYDIPIAKITDDFLEYIKHMEALNIELASDFILTASILMRIKARMLLPRRDLNEEGEEIDPREELTRQLLEYKKYKGIENEMRTLEEDRSLKFKRGNISANVEHIGQFQDHPSELYNISLFNLLNAFNKVLQRYDKESRVVQHTIVRFPYKIEEQKERLLGSLRANKISSFDKVFSTCENRIHAIFTFLALLEMIQQRIINIKSGSGFNNFWVELN